MDEFLTAKAWVHGHHKNHVHHVEQIFDRLSRGRRVQRHASLNALGFNRLNGAVNMRASLDVRGDHIGTRFGVGFDIGIDGRDHQVHVHERFHMRAERFDGGRAKGQVRDKVTIHHVHMNPVSALRFDGLNFLTEICEIGRENRRCDLDRAVKRHWSAFFCGNGQGSSAENAQGHALFAAAAS